MHSRQFTQEQKAASIGIREAAQIADVHNTTIYDWRRKLDGLGEERFLAYQPFYSGRGIKVISAEKEAAVLDCWKSNPGFGAGRSGGSSVGIICSLIPPNLSIMNNQDATALFHG